MSIFERWTQAPTERFPDVLPRYCGRCGQPLVKQEQALGFDPQTGRAVSRYWLRCQDAERIDTPYQPRNLLTVHARYVTCDLSGWAEARSTYDLYSVDFVTCEPWPKPPVTPDLRKKGSA